MASYEEIAKWAKSRKKLFVTSIQIEYKIGYEDAEKILNRLIDDGVVSRNKIDFSDIDEMEEFVELFAKMRRIDHIDNINSNLKIANDEFEKLFQIIYTRKPTRNQLNNFVKLLLARYNDSEVLVFIKFYGLFNNKLESVEQISNELGIDEEECAELIKSFVVRMRKLNKIKKVFLENQLKKYRTISLDTDLKETILSIRTINLLKKENINTVADLFNISLYKLISINNLGRKSYQEIAEFIINNRDLVEMKKWRY